MKLSVIIPSRNEFPQIAFTIYSIVHDLETFLDYKDFEIIIVNNCSDDEVFPRRGMGGTVDYLMARGMYWNGMLRVIHDPQAGNHSARNKGVEVARGDYVFISDAHMSYNVGFFKSMLKACEESGGIVHATINWMGAFPPTQVGYQYTIKLGEEIKGTWSNRLVGNRENWFYIPAQGHCSVMVNRKQFLDFGGYPLYHRTYGGGEFYLDMKWWMFGSSVVVDPKAMGYHLACGRGYTYSHDDYIHNVLYIGKALSMDEWTERAYINWLRHHDKETMERLMLEAEKEANRGERQFIEKRKVKSFNEVIVERPWDKLNDEKHGSHNSGLLVYHDTIIPLFQENEASKEAWENAKYKDQLDKFINENLSDFVYRSKIKKTDSL